MSNNSQGIADALKPWISAEADQERNDLKEQIATLTMQLSHMEQRYIREKQLNRNATMAVESAYSAYDDIVTTLTRYWKENRILKQRLVDNGISPFVAHHDSNIIDLTIGDSASDEE